MSLKFARVRALNCEELREIPSATDLISFFASYPPISGHRRESDGI